KGVFKQVLVIGFVVTVVLPLEILRREIFIKSAARAAGLDRQANGPSSVRFNSGIGRDGRNVIEVPIVLTGLAIGFAVWHLPGLAIIAGLYVVILLADRMKLGVLVGAVNKSEGFGAQVTRAGPKNNGINKASSRIALGRVMASVTPILTKVSLYAFYLWLIFMVHAPLPVLILLSMLQLGLRAVSVLRSYERLLSKFELMPAFNEWLRKIDDWIMQGRSLADIKDDIRDGAEAGELRQELISGRLEKYSELKEIIASSKADPEKLEKIRGIFESAGLKQMGIALVEERGFNLAFADLSKEIDGSLGVIYIEEKTIIVEEKAHPILQAIILMALSGYLYSHKTVGSIHYGVEAAFKKAMAKLIFRLLVLWWNNGEKGSIAQGLSEEQLASLIFVSPLKMVYRRSHLWADIVKLGRIGQMENLVITAKELLRKNSIKQVYPEYSLGTPAADNKLSIAVYLSKQIRPVISYALPLLAKVSILIGLYVPFVMNFDWNYNFEFAIQLPFVASVIEILANASHLVGTYLADLYISLSNIHIFASLVSSLASVFHQIVLYITHVYTVLMGIPVFAYVANLLQPILAPLANSLANALHQIYVILMEMQLSDLLQPFVNLIDAVYHKFIVSITAYYHIVKLAVESILVPVVFVAAGIVAGLMLRVIQPLIYISVKFIRSSSLRAMAKIGITLLGLAFLSILAISGAGILLLLSAIVNDSLGQHVLDEAIVRADFYSNVIPSCPQRLVPYVDSYLLSIFHCSGNVMKGMEFSGNCVSILVVFLTGMLQSLGVLVNYILVAAGTGASVLSVPVYILTHIIPLFRRVNIKNNVEHVREVVRWAKSGINLVVGSTTAVISWAIIQNRALVQSLRSRKYIGALVGAVSKSEGLGAQVTRAGPSAIIKLLLLVFLAIVPINAAKADAVIGQVYKGQGEASSFSPQKTASGRAYRGKELLCALLPKYFPLKLYPFGSRVKVTNLRNGRSLEVVRADSGPHVAPTQFRRWKGFTDALLFRGHKERRIIDLSLEAARRLGMADGLAPVQIEMKARKVAPKNPSTKPVKSSAIPAFRARSGLSAFVALIGTGLLLGLGSISQADSLITAAAAVTHPSAIVLFGAFLAAHWLPIAAVLVVIAVMVTNGGNVNGNSAFNHLDIGFIRGYSPSNVFIRILAKKLIVLNDLIEKGQSPESILKPLTENGGNDFFEMKYCGYRFYVLFYPIDPATGKRTNDRSHYRILMGIYDRRRSENGPSYYQQTYETLKNSQLLSMDDHDVLRSQLYDVAGLIKAEEHKFAGLIAKILNEGVWKNLPPVKSFEKKLNKLSRLVLNGELQEENFAALQEAVERLNAGLRGPDNLELFDIFSAIVQLCQEYNLDFDQAIEIAYEHSSQFLQGDNTELLKPILRKRIEVLTLYISSILDTLEKEEFIRSIGMFFGSQEAPADRATLECYCKLANVFGESLGLTRPIEIIQEELESWLRTVPAEEDRQAVLSTVSEFIPGIDIRKMQDLGEAAQAVSRVEDLGRTKEILENQQRLLCQKIKEAKNSREAHQQHLTDIEGMRENLKDLILSREKLQQTVSFLDAWITVASVQIQLWQDQIQALQEQKEENESYKPGLLDRIKVVGKAGQTRELKMKSRGDQFDLLIGELERSIQEKQDARKAWQEDLGSKQGELEELNENIESLTVKIDAAEARTVGLSEKADKAREELKECMGSSYSEGTEDVLKQAGQLREELNRLIQGYITQIRQVNRQKVGRFEGLGNGTGSWMTGLVAIGMGVWLATSVQAAPQAGAAAVAAHESWWLAAGIFGLANWAVAVIVGLVVIAGLIGLIHYFKAQKLEFGAVVAGLARTIFVGSILAVVLPFLMGAAPQAGSAAATVLQPLIVVALAVAAAIALSCAAKVKRA
ncbi:MAG: hypothetical protein WCY12_05835, partial [Candidatus Omnitrophota bacterium]